MRERASLQISVTVPLFSQNDNNKTTMDSGYEDLTVLVIVISLC